MASTLSSLTISAAISALLTSGTDPAKSTCTSTLNCSAVPVAATDVNFVYAANTTLTSGSTWSVDLTNFTDPLGNSVTTGAKLVGYAIKNTGTTGQTLTIGAGTNGIIASAESSEPVQALNGFRAEWFPDGGITIDSTHKIFQAVAGGGGTVPFQVVLFVK